MRTVYCGDLSISDVGAEVILCGWVNRRRVFGNFIFIEIRDREGNIQIFFDSSYDNNSFISATQLRNEYCVQIFGTVRARPVHQINFDMKTGEIEILARNMKIISVSEPLPVDLHKDSSEEKRLLYRYLDLRRPVMFQRLKNRSRITSYVHRFMEKKGFLNIETPMLTHPTPEGARDYLVPSRLHTGKFYALPQSPQIFKQLLMISGFDRYYQIIKCFRDEDTRSDRQPEFTQIDLETSFMTVEKVREIVECLIKGLWHEILDVELKKFPQLTYKEAIDRFASDSPDLRNPIDITYISNIPLKEIKCDVSSFPKRKNYTSFKVMIMRVPNGAQLSYDKICQYVDEFKFSGGTNLTWVKIIGYGGKKKIEGSAMNFFSCDVLERIFFEVLLTERDLLFLSCTDGCFLNHTLCELRLKLGSDLNLINKDKWAPLWIVDFPMFKRDVQGNVVSMHHLFTAPKNVNCVDLLKDPLSAVASSFDMVINGCEVGSGSMRINSIKMQKIVFEILGLSEDVQEDQFGFLLNALKYGAPVHAGMACGLDRLVMLLNRTSNIRDIIAFPKTTCAVDLMTKTPGFFNAT